MGFVLFSLLAGLSLMVWLWWARPGRPPAVALVAALLLAAIGYAWQGSPTLAGSPAASTRAARATADPLFAGERRVWLGEVGPEADLLASADTLIAQGSADYAIGVLRGATNRTPDDMGLWIGLGHAFAMYADGMVTPAARFCFARAARIAPRHPAPRYFLGLALFTAGDLDGAEAVWRTLQADLPPDGDPHRMLAIRLATLHQLRSASRSRTGPAGGDPTPGQD